MTMHGSCLCGEIQFEITGEVDEFSHCYCARCRKATGAGHSSVLIASPDQLSWTRGGNKVKRWDLPKAQSFATAFCPDCGCGLPRLSRDGGCAVIPAGSIDSEIVSSPKCHEHYASKANWVDLNELHLPVFKNESR